MSGITVDRALAEKLQRGECVIDLFDDAGKLLGMFVRNPVLPPPYDPADLPPPMTEEELEERLSGPFVTTEEVFAKLRAL